MKKTKIFRIKHGWFGGGYQEVYISPTIDANIQCWHILIVEEKKTNDEDKKCNK